MITPGNSTEDDILFRIAPRLKRSADRLWVRPDAMPVSFPLDAQAHIATVEDASFWFRHRNSVIATIVSKYPTTINGPLFDLGGGNGTVALALKRRGIPVIVVEPGLDGARIAHGRGLAVIHGSFDSDMFNEGTLPAVCLFDVIEHIENDVDFLVECRGAMASGGFLYATVPALQWLWSADDAYAGHYRRYGRTSLQRTLRQAGFEVVTISAFFSLLVPPLLFLRTLPSACGWRKVTDADKAFAHHHASDGSVGALVERLLTFELAAIARGYIIPWGTSLFAVARKPIN